MTPRERFREALTFGKPDKVPLQPGGPRESTLAAWRNQGLLDRDYYEVLLEVLGIEPEPIKTSRVNLGVPPDVSWPNFVEYTRLLAELTEWL
ncbi:MAG: hypothetical protein DRQ08_08830 [Candidatus Latescibacterota bacterium]|nr:MAG: hypothetical protein DRQ08_08830 [Candidatus Latescibacterota bacterium]